jgi:hypothetical protein
VTLLGVLPAEPNVPPGVMSVYMFAQARSHLTGI